VQKNNRLIIISLMIFFTISFISCKSSQQKENQNIDAAFKNIAEKLSKAKGRMKKGTVAVFGFEMIGRKDDNYSRYATEKLTNELVEVGKLTVIERSQIDKLLREQNFSLSGIVDASQAAKIGKILSVEGVVIGTISVNGNQVELIARIVQSETAVILGSASFRYNIKPFPVPGLTGKKDIVIKGDDGDDGDDIQNQQSNTVITYKKVYRSGKRITIKYDGMPGNNHDWITLIKASKSDSTYEQWFYTNGKASGSHTFRGVKPGKYEIRIYYNWPSGGYQVQKRIKVLVK
jgi:TolB-like protein